MDSVVPSNGHIVSGYGESAEFEWSGTNTVQASLAATDPNAAQREADLTFLAGIASATAAAAFIAFIQELRPKIPRRVKLERRPPVRRD